MTTSRRDILQRGAMIGSAMMLPTPTLLIASPLDDTARMADHERWIGCRKQGDQHFATQFDRNASILTNTPLPGRSHGITISPDAKTALIVARRPGTFAVQIELETGEILAQIESASDRHFYGHACFSGDGTKLFLTENDIETGNGIVSIKDANDGLKELTHFSSGGIGPHELCWLSDDKTLAIANGGIMTRPETGRTPLNLDTMSPSLCLIDAASGTIRATHQLSRDLNQLSIRHLSAFGGRIALALQYEGAKSSPMPLLALFDVEGLQLVETPTPLAAAMRNYAGSIAHDISGELIAMTCPKANLLTFWDAKTGEPVGHQRQTDVCGIAAGSAPGEFVATAQTTTFIASLAALEPKGTIANSHWDNHLTRIA